MSDDNTQFVRITDDQYSDMLVATAEHLPETSNISTTKARAKSETQERIELNISASSPLSEKQSLKSESLPFKQAVSRKEETWYAHGALRREFLGRMQVGSKISDLNNKDMLNISDTGGQPMFHEVLPVSVSYTHLRAHETLRYLVCRLLLEKKK